jgi:hypothetical protein
LRAYFQLMESADHALVFLGFGVPALLAGLATIQTESQGIGDYPTA